jgi:hypothetical protein
LPPLPTVTADGAGGGELSDVAELLSALSAPSTCAPPAPMITERTV